MGKVGRLGAFNKKFIISSGFINKGLLEYSYGKLERCLNAAVVALSKWRAAPVEFKEVRNIA